METQSMRVTQGGRLVLPAFVRKIFNIHAGGRLNVQIVEGEIRLQPRQEALRRIQALVRHRIPKGQSLADELLADRRAAAQREANQAARST